MTHYPLIGFGPLVRFMVAIATVAWCCSLLVSISGVWLPCSHLSLWGVSPLFGTSWEDCHRFQSSRSLLFFFWVQDVCGDGTTIPPLLIYQSNSGTLLDTWVMKSIQKNIAVILHPLQKAGQMMSLDLCPNVALESFNNQTKPGQNQVAPGPHVFPRRILGLLQNYYKRLEVIT